MGRNSKIIELYGLPASGKSTLTKKLLKETISAIAIEDYMKEVKKHKIKALICTNYKNFYNHSINILNTKTSLKMKLINLIDTIKIETTYNYFKKYSEIEYLISDHGLIQQFVSIMNGHKYKDKNLKYIKRIMNRCHIDYAIMTAVDIETAQKRMIKRNRSIGRLDIEKNTDKQKEMFQKELINFEKINEFIKQNFKNIKHKEFDTQSIENINIESIIK